MKPVQRLNKDSLGILEKYAPNVNHAIFTMEIKLQEQGRAIHMLQSVTKPVEKVLQPATFGEKPESAMAFHTDSYWKKLSETVDSCIERAKRY